MSKHEQAMEKTRKLLGRNTAYTIDDVIRTYLQAVSIEFKPSLERTIFVDGEPLYRVSGDDIYCLDCGETGLLESWLTHVCGDQP